MEEKYSEICYDFAGWINLSVNLKEEIMKVIKNISKIVAFVLLPLFVNSFTFATGATVVIAGPMAPIPTLSGTMLVILSLLLFVVALRVAKQKNGSNFFISLIGVFALVSGGSGIKLVTDAHAGLGGGTILLDPGIQTSYRLINDVNDPFSGFNGAIVNNSGQAITVLSIINDATSSCALFNQSSFCPQNIPTQAAFELPDGEGCAMSCQLNQFSDIRLKRDIHYLGKLKQDFKVYSFKYIPEYDSSDVTYVGVMAQDLLKDFRYKNTVKIMGNGFYAVNYAALGLKMITIDQWKQSQDNVLKL